AHSPCRVEAGASATIRLRLTDQSPTVVRHSAPAVVVEGISPFGSEFDELLARRRQEADTFYAMRVRSHMGEDAARVQRQAFAGNVWSKQFYHHDLEHWLQGDPARPPPPQVRTYARNPEPARLYHDHII